MSRSLLRPGWILTHLVVIAIAVGFVSLGMWQLNRATEVKADNARRAEVLDAPPVPLDQALAAPDIDIQPVTATGTFQTGDQVMLSPRSRNDRPGFDVLAAVTLEDGRTLMVNRGWMPLDDPVPPVPSGQVELGGRLRPPTDARQVLPPGGDTAELLSAVDLEVLSGQFDDLITTGYLEVVDDQAVAAGELPRPAEPISLEDGPHISYAIQWFAFTAIGLIGYPLLLRRRIADAKDEQSSPGPDRSMSQNLVQAE